MIDRIRLATLWEVPDEQIKDLQDGTWVIAHALMFHWTVIQGDWDMLDVGYFERWCYADKALAMKALQEFPVNPPSGYEPSGWHRHHSSGRRRPDGNKILEYVEH